jgi:uridine kinase
MYTEIVARIRQLLEKQTVVIVAISGHGGSGKTTLAAKLAEEFDVTNDQIVHIDALHAANYMQIKDIYQQHDWKTLADLLTRARSDERLNYPTRDWKGNAGNVDVTRPRVVIVEGIRLIRPDLMPLFDVTVWIDCPAETAAARAIERNREQGDSDEEINLWYTKWVPEAKRYEADAQPHKIADFAYRTYTD